MKGKNGFGYPSAGLVFILVLVVVVLAAAQNGADVASLTKVTDSGVLNWSSFGKNITNPIEIAFSIDKPEYMQVIGGIIIKAVDFFGYSVFAVAKLATHLAIENPDIINYKVLLALIFLSLLAPLIYPAFMISVAFFLLIREYIQDRREKRILKKLKEQNESP